MEEAIKSPNEKLQALYREYADMKEQTLSAYSSSRQKHQLFSDKKFEAKLIDEDESLFQSAKRRLSNNMATIGYSKQ